LGHFQKSLSSRPEVLYLSLASHLDKFWTNGIITETGGKISE
jgi:hypothetical protein